MDSAFLSDTLERLSEHLALNGQEYTSDAVTSAFFKMICKKAGVKYQIFTNNSNIAGGSTLGNISQNHVSIPCVDIGLAQ